MTGKGVAGDLSLAWGDLVAFKNTFTGPIPQTHEHRYAASGIDRFHGEARFTGRNTLDVAGQAVTARHILIASGAEPTPLGIPGEEHVGTNESFYDLEVLPRRVVLVGGGYIAAEYSHLAARAGAQVTILQRSDRILPHFDPDLVGWLIDKFRELGVDVRTNTVVEAVEKGGSGFLVRASCQGEAVSFEADMVLHAAGRRPALDGLELEVANIAHDDGRLLLNEYLQSVSNPAIYAAGDAAQVGPPLTPVSSHDAKVVADNLLEGNHRSPDYRGVPSVAFTVPPIASVGMSEREAREQGRSFPARSSPTAP